MRCSALSLLVTVLVSALLLSVASPVAAVNQLIFTDYTSGVSFTLPTGLTNIADSDLPYSTSSAGQLQIGLNFNNDAADEFSLAFSSLPQLSVVSTNNPQQCGLTGSGVVLNASNPHCNYTVAWSGLPFTGVLSITYNTGATDGPSSAQQISIPFTAAAIVGDPQFIGLLGQRFQVHGIDGAVYNLISSSRTQVNARFVFLSSGDCPLSVSSRTDCWSHPGSYIAEMSFQHLCGDELHTLRVVAGSATEGFSHFFLSTPVGSPAIRVQQPSSHSLQVTLPDWQFTLQNSDGFMNQQLQWLTPLSVSRPHGLIGQTWQHRLYPSPLRYIEGEVDDYVLTSGHIFGIAFVYNRFGMPENQTVES